MTSSRVAIIEPSPALGCGLSKLICDKGDRFDVVGIYRDFASFRIDLVTEVDIILINPLLVDFHATVRDAFPHDESKAFLVAIPYGYINPEALKGYDGVLNLFDDGEALVLQLMSIIGSHKSDGRESSVESVLYVREKEIIIAVAQGLSSKEISTRLGLSKHTITTYRNKISAKIGARGAMGLSAYAHLHGLIKQK